MNRHLFAGIALLGLLISVSSGAETIDIRAAIQAARAAAQGVDALIVVLDESAQTKKGANPLSSGAFGFVAGSEKMFDDSAFTGKKGRALTAAQSRAGRNLQNMYRVRLNDGADVSAALETLNASSAVKYAEPDWPVELFAAPNDTYFDEQYTLSNTGQEFYTIRSGVTTNGTPGADVNWLPAYTNSSLWPTGEIIIAVVDTGIDYTHEDLTNQMWKNTAELNGSPDVDDDGNGYIDDIYGYNFALGESDPMDDHLHGSHCAGIIAAEAGNAKGVSGVIPHARLMACKMFAYIDGYLTGSSSAGVEGIKYAADMGATVISCSWGGGGYLQALSDVIDYANDLGAQVVCAAGNDGWSAVKYPAGYRGAVSIGATDQDDEKASFSNYGTWVDMMAPGHNILSVMTSGASPPNGYTLLGSGARGSYLNISGTSMATPCAAGIFGLMMQKFPGLDPWLYRKAMQEACDDVDALNPGYEGLLGAGRMNVAAALSYNETNAWLTGWIDFPPGIGSAFLAPGQKTNALIQVGSWIHPVSNVTVSIRADSSGVQILGATNYVLGDLAAGTVTNLPNDTFTVRVKSDTAWGSAQYVLAELWADGVKFGEKRLTVPVYGGWVGKFAPYDLDGDGKKEIVANAGDIISCFNADGSLRWFTQIEVSGMYGGSAAVCAGDVDGDGKGEVVVSTYNLLGGGVSVYLLQDDGTFNTNEWPVQDESWYETHPPCLGDLDGDGDMEIIIASSRSGEGDFVSVLETNGTFAWETPAQSGYDFDGPSVADIDFDGDLEIVLREYRVDGDGVIQWKSFGVVVDHTGAVVKRFPLTGTFEGADDDTDAEFQGALGDIDGDGYMEMVGFITAGEDGAATLERRKQVVAYDLRTGQMKDGNWPLDIETAPSGGYDIPRLADMDGDGDMEIFFYATDSDRIFGVDHLGNNLPGYPLAIKDNGLTYLDEADITQWQTLFCADVDGDAAPELLLLKDYRTSDGDYAFDIYAWEGDGFKVHDYPRTVEGTDALFSDPYFELSVVNLDESPFATNATLVMTVGSHLLMEPLGAAYYEEAQHWNLSNADPQRSRSLVLAAGGLHANLWSTNRFGFNSLTGDFFMHVTGTNRTGLWYAWDMDNDGTNDYAGSSYSNVTHSYSSPGVYSIGFTVSNAAGEVVSGVREDYVVVYSDLSAEFSADHTTVSAPARIQFTDASTGPVQSWFWTFGDGESSTEQNPSHTYTNTGTYAVSLTVECDFGAGHSSTNVETKTGYITVSGVMSGITNHYVSLDGAHIWPFKTWADAATNIQAAVDAAVEMGPEGHSVIVTNGTYYREDSPSLRIVANDLTVRSVNGPLVTLIDGERTKGGVFINGTNILFQGFTVQRCVSTTVAGGGITVGSMFAGTETTEGTRVDNCIIRNNEVQDITGGEGGGIALLRGAQLSNSQIYSNRAWQGGGVKLYLGSVTNCVIRDNEGIRGAGGLICTTEEDEVRNCLFTGNRGISAVGFYFGGNMYNCTIAGNVTTKGALDITGASMFNLRHENNIIYGNTGPGGDLYENLSGLSETYHQLVNNCTPVNLNGKTDVSYGNITADPKFIDPDNGNYRLAPDSPCLNTGYMEAMTTGNPVKRAWIDLGPQITSGAGWNNLTNRAAGASIANLVGTNGTATGWGIEILKSFNENYTNGFYTNAFAYPAAAQEDGFLIYEDDDPEVVYNTYYDYLQFSGLSTSGVYDVTVYASAPPDFAGRSLRFRIDEILMGPVVVNGGDSLTASDLSFPSGSFILESGDFSQDTRLGVLDLVEYAVGYAITNQTDLDGMPRVSGPAVDMGCYEYDGNYPPVCDASATPDSIQAGESVTFDASASYDLDGTITNYVWDFGDGTGASGASLSNTTHSYSAVNWYAARCTVYDDGDKSDSVDILVKVGPLMPTTPEAFGGTNVSPTANTLTWQDADNETGYVISRGEYSGEPVDVIINENDPECRLLSGSNPHVWRPGTNNLTPAQGAFSTEYFVNLDGGPYAQVSSQYRHSGNDHLFDAFIAPNLPAGTYEIYEWHPQHQTADEYLAEDWSNVDQWNGNLPLAKRAVYDVYGAGAVDKRYADCSDGFSQWNSLGTARLNEYSYIHLNCLPNIREVVVLDAVRFVKRTEYTPVATLGAGVTNWTDTSAVDNTTYTYYIKATNAYGESPWVKCDVHAPTTNALPVVSIDSLSNSNGVPSLPVSVSGSASDADGTITNYVWDFGDGYVGSVQSGPALTSANYTYRYEGEYDLTLTAYDDRGFSSSVSVPVKVAESVPNKPYSFVATSTGPNAIQLEWGDAALNEDGFLLERGTDTNSYSSLADLGVNVWSYNDSTVEPGTLYWYRLAAYNAAGTSDWATVSASSLSVDYELPFEETFESSPTNMAGTLGVLDGQHGWVSGTGAVVQAAVARDAQALALTDEDASHSFLGSPTNVWITFWMQGQPGETADVDADAVAAFYMATNSALVVFDGTNATETAEVFSNDWNKVELFINTVSKHWNISLNGTQAATNLGFYSDASAVGTLALREVSDGGTAYFDDILISASPADDADGDGLPDAWEEQYFGSNAPAPTDPASNSTYTVRQAYIAGLDPTDPDAEFTLSNVRNILGWNAATGRVYTIWWTSNLLSGFQLLESNFTGGAFTDTTHSAHGEGFYKIDVRVE